MAPVSRKLSITVMYAVVAIRLVVDGGSLALFAPAEPRRQMPGGVHTSAHQKPAVAASASHSSSPSVNCRTFLAQVLGSRLIIVCACACHTMKTRRAAGKAAPGAAAAPAAGAATDQPRAADLAHNSVKRPDQVLRLDVGSLGDQLVQLAEAIGATDSPVPALQRHACELYSLLASSRHLHSSSTLLTRVIKLSPSISLQLLLAAVTKGDKTRFHALIDAGADVNGCYSPSGVPDLRGVHNTLLYMAVMTGQPSMIPSIVAVPALDLKRSVRLLSRAVWPWECSIPEPRFTADQLACAAALLAQQRVLDDLHAPDTGLVALLASACGDVDMLARLQNPSITGNYVLANGGTWGQTVLHVAEAYGQVPVLQWLHDRELGKPSWATSLFNHIDLGGTAASHSQLAALEWFAAHGYLSGEMGVHLYVHTEENPDEGDRTPNADHATMASRGSQRKHGRRRLPPGPLQSGRYVGHSCAPRCCARWPDAAAEALD